MTINKLVLPQMFVVILFLGCALSPSSSQSKNPRQQFEPTITSRRYAITTGQGKEYSSAMEYYASEAVTKGRYAEASTALTQAAAAAAQMGQLQKAIAYGTEAFDLAKKTEDTNGQTDALITLADTYARVGQSQKAREWLEKAQAIVARIPESQSRNMLEARLARMLGESYLRKRDTQRAIEHLSRSVGMWDARLSYLRSSAGEGVRDRQGAVKLSEENLSTSLHRLGLAFLQSANSVEAVKAFERGLSILAASGLKSPIESSIYIGLGRSYRAQNDTPSAMKTFTKSLDLAEARGQTDQIQRAATNLGDILLATGRSAGAIRYYKKAIDTIESVRFLLESEELRSAFFESKGRAYIGMVIAHQRLQNAVEAFNYSERARSRALLDILGNKVELARSGTILEHERALQARIRVLQAMLTGREEASEQADELALQLTDAQNAYNEFLVKLRKENREQASLMNVEPLDLKRVQELLDPGVTMLDFFVTPRAVLIWVVEKDKVRFVRSSITTADLVSKVSSLRNTLYQMTENERFSALSQELFKLLIEPALPSIRGKELLIVPHGVLHYLPFQSLLGNDGHYLIEKYSIYYLTSASVLQFTQEKRRAKGENVLAFGNPDLGDPTRNLEYAELEAHEIKSAYPQSAVYLKKDATEGKAKALSPSNDIIHFATHAELKEDDPLSSAILLAKDDKEDGRLEAREIFGMNLKANLVVLSGCDTGLGKLSTGDELVGLTRAFIYAGTPSVVASLWKIDDSSTAHLMSSFYKNLKTMSKVEALRQAQLQLIRGKTNSDLLARRGIGGVGKLGETPSSEHPAPSSEPHAPISISTSHPYFWAPFILVGEGK